MTIKLALGGKMSKSGGEQLLWDNEEYDITGTINIKDTAMHDITIYPDGKWELSKTNSLYTKEYKQSIKL